MEHAEQDKSEQPTAYKLMRSRRKGVVARGTDLGFLASLSAFAAYGWVAGVGLIQDVKQLAAATLVTAGQVAQGPQELLQITGTVSGRMVRPLTLLSATLFGIVLLVELAQTGVVFSTAPLKPDFGRLNPATGLKRLFTLRLLIETVKNLLKLAAYTTVAILCISSALFVNSVSTTDARRLAATMASSWFRLTAEFLGLACLFALLDQFLSRRLFLRQMRMSRREVRRELRDREGDPRIKQRRKQLHAQLIKASEALRSVRGSDVVITNPTRIAVALKYDSRTMAAPVITARGARDLAKRIRELAFTYGVLIVEDRPLAQDLFRRCSVGREIPTDQYQRVAAIYRKLRSNTAPNGDGDA